MEIVKLLFILGIPTPGRESLLKMQINAHTF